MPSAVPTVEEELFKEVAAELDLSYKLVRDIVLNGQGLFTKHLMESDNYDAIRWPYMGKFKVKMRHMQVKHYMKGMQPMFRHIYRQQIREGYIFPERYSRKQKEIHFAKTPRKQKPDKS